MFLCYRSAVSSLLLPLSSGLISAEQPLQASTLWPICLVLQCPACALFVSCRRAGFACIDGEFPAAGLSLRNESIAEHVTQGYDHRNLKTIPVGPVLTSSFRADNPPPSAKDASGVLSIPPEIQGPETATQNRGSPNGLDRLCSCPLWEPKRNFSLHSPRAPSCCGAPRDTPAPERSHWSKSLWWGQEVEWRQRKKGNRRQTEGSHPKAPEGNSPRSGRRDCANRLYVDTAQLVISQASCHIN